MGWQRLETVQECRVRLPACRLKTVLHWEFSVLAGASGSFAGRRRTPDAKAGRGDNTANGLHWGGDESGLRRCRGRTDNGEWQPTLSEDAGECFLRASQEFAIAPQADCPLGFA